MNGTINRHNSTYLVVRNVHRDRSMSLSSILAWCGLSARQVIGPFFFYENATGRSYLEMLQSQAMPAIQELYDDVDVIFQQDGAPLHYHRDVRSFLNRTRQVDGTARKCEVSAALS